MWGVSAVVVLFLLLLPAASAQSIDDSEAVTWLHAEVIREGTVTLTGSPGSVRDLNVTLSVPQNSTRQVSFVKSLSGPDGFVLSRDEWGNEMITLQWKSPAANQPLTYRVVSDVEVFDREVPSLGREYLTTALTEANQEISEKAFDLAIGNEGIEIPFGLADWVHRWLEYEESCGEFAESAQWAFRERRGVCDEFSVLLISMLRELGYNAYYVVGYAHSDSWGQHGWVEVDLEGKALSIDPTWLESPVDATHIELARTPDSNFTEFVELKSSGMKIDWDKGEPEIRVIGSEEGPKFSMESEAVPSMVGSGSDALLKVKLTAAKPGRCILSYVRAKSCTTKEGVFFAMDENNKTASFCGQDVIYWFLGVPELEEGVMYSCPITVYGGGVQEIADTSAFAEYGRPMELSLGTMSVLSSGQGFNATVGIRNPGTRFEDLDIYLFFSGDALKESVRVPPGESRSLVAGLTAPGYPGEYELVVFSSSGHRTGENITVMEKRSFRIEEISVPQEVKVNQSFWINITLKATESGKEGTLRIMIGEESSEEGFDLGESETIRVMGILEEPGTYRVNAVVLSPEGSYQASWRGDILAEGEYTFFDSAMEWLRSVISAARSWMQGILDSLISSFA
jgi:hypothetical protein